MQGSLENFAKLLAERELSISFNLSDKQKKFLECIKQGVCIHMTKEAKESKEFQELTNLLSNMHKDGIIHIFQIVEE